MNLSDRPPVSQAMIAPSRIRGILLTLIAPLALALAPASAAAAPKVDGAPFPVAVTGLEANSKIVEGQDGNIWVAVANNEMDVARITPSGTVNEFALESGGVKFEGASGIARDANGHLWVTGEGKIAEFTPTLGGGPPSGVAVDDLAQSKGGGVGGASIVLGPDGNMWIATAENVIKFPPNSPEPPENTRTLIPVPELNPHDIDVAGNLVVVADQKNRIVTVDPKNGNVGEFPLDGFSQGIAGMKSGMIAYSESGADPQAVGLISPPNKLAPIQTPKPGGDPFGVTVGQDGAFWFVMGAFGSLARLEPGGTSLSFVDGMPKAGLERQIATGPNNTLWVTVTSPGSEAVARVSGVEKPLVEPPPVTKPDTMITKGAKARVRARGRRRAKVSFRFSSNPAGASFECRLVRRGSKALGFSTCKSPKAYMAKPGRYRFEVRAVLGGVTDSTPATRSFRVTRF